LYPNGTFGGTPLTILFFSQYLGDRDKGIGEKIWGFIGFMVIAWMGTLLGWTIAIATVAGLLERAV